MRDSNMNMKVADGGQFNNSIWCQCRCNADERRVKQLWNFSSQADMKPYHVVVRVGLMVLWNMVGRKSAYVGLAIWTLK